jgi:hypothetical protein
LENGGRRIASSKPVLAICNKEILSQHPSPPKKERFEQRKVMVKICLRRRECSKSRVRKPGWKAADITVYGKLLRG